MRQYGVEMARFTSAKMNKFRRKLSSLGGSTDKDAVVSKIELQNRRLSSISANGMDEEKLIVKGQLIKAASLEKLAMLCVDCFDDAGELQDNPFFPRMVFLMHKWFVSSEELAALFINLYQTRDKSICKSPCQHKPSDQNCKLNRFKTRVCYTVRSWISEFPMHFDLDPSLAREIRNLQELTCKDSANNHKLLVDISNLPSYDWMRAVSVRNSVKRSHKVSLVFDHLEPHELAEQITVLEYKIFRRISFSDFRNYAIHGKLQDNPRLERSIMLFNGLSLWVQCMVLSKSTPQYRAQVITKFVNVAKALRQLQNFNSLMAVVGGLSHSSIARLTKTASHLPAEINKALHEMTEMLSSNGNFANYRKQLSECKGFKIPILGVHLKDLIALHTALHDKVENGLLNVRKMAQLAVVFNELIQLQSTSPDIEANMDLINTLKVSLDLQYSEEEIYELSLAREPRESASAPPTPIPSEKPVFADWASGITPTLDSDTLKKHVHAMVEAVYKNYDHDRDGYISHQEFDSIAGNFPFIDSFGILDADHFARQLKRFDEVKHVDGMISKEEMKMYFIRANCHALSSGFRHDFVETTYFKPTYCEHCSGLLWGLIKQGWKCRDCTISCHKHCKELVVVECRPRGSVSSGPQSSNTSLLQDTDTSRATSADEQPSPRGTERRRQSSRLRYLAPVHQSTQTVKDSGISLMDSASSVNLNLEYNDDEVFVEEDVGSLRERLRQSEEARAKLASENQTLQTELASAHDRIKLLQSHIGQIRQHTVSFILDQMDILKMQRDTEV
ncbi:PREDICTED: ras guanyl-releasing protein 3-like isoform X1 [Branchiostoma belcheri]|uniref:Ras guanyl-releasing protein 3-like isoform X1 n=1 Tax=Branchiostoma belcheri TaxID=7741 RepID=A0A6P4ZZU7_BRABE|nr:PREDICTED: ras guanyl-releasing protein 3-like isoform X1 [Branchiostoma belcheri]XP_019642509.1 PREDICTED: ras guanyl-releasing protein 3-like isoform X1 [Branchiostoma belcheri]XP_019642510.1 PREDICTED: ras guanyl-releasing protein 3-like isoform X1 [Branchiostoma belcheri]